MSKPRTAQEHDVGTGERKVSERSTGTAVPGDPGWGLTLDVFVRSIIGLDTQGGDLTAHCGRLTLVGVVDCRRHTRWTPEQIAHPVESPVTAWLPREYRQNEPAAATAPAVWLIKDRWEDGERFLIPARDDDGQPDWRYSQPGGRFAAAKHPMFWQVMESPFRGAVPVHDKRPA